MQVKKSPKADLNRNSGLYFQIGLILVLFITWRALEHKTYHVDKELVQLIDMQEDLKEEVPITEVIKTPPPPPPPSAPEVIEIVEDEETILFYFGKSKFYILPLEHINETQLSDVRKIISKQHEK